MVSAICCTQLEGRVSGGLVACDSGVGRLGFLEGSERSVESSLRCTGLGPGSSLSGSLRGVQSGIFSCDRHVAEGGDPRNFHLKP